MLPLKGCYLQPCCPSRTVTYSNVAPQGPLLTAMLPLQRSAAFLASSSSFSLRPRCRLYRISMKIRKTPATIPPATIINTPATDKKMSWSELWQRHKHSRISMVNIFTLVWQGLEKGDAHVLLKSLISISMWLYAARRYLGSKLCIDEDRGNFIYNWNIVLKCSRWFYCGCRDLNYSIFCCTNHTLEFNKSSLKSYVQNLTSISLKFENPSP